MVFVVDGCDAATGKGAIPRTGFWPILTTKNGFKTGYNFCPFCVISEFHRHPDIFKCKISKFVYFVIIQHLKILDLISAWGYEWIQCKRTFNISSICDVTT